MLSVVVAAWGGWLSFQALKARDDVDAEDAAVRKMLRYWACFAFLVAYDAYAAWLFSWIPGHGLARAAAVALVFLPPPAWGTSDVAFFCGLFPASHALWAVAHGCVFSVLAVAHDLAAECARPGLFSPKVKAPKTPLKTPPARDARRRIAELLRDSDDSDEYSGLFTANDDLVDDEPSMSRVTYTLARLTKIWEYLFAMLTMEPTVEGLFLGFQNICSRDTSCPTKLCELILLRRDDCKKDLRNKMLKAEREAFRRQQSEMGEAIYRSEVGSAVITDTQLEAGIVFNDAPSLRRDPRCEPTADPAERAIIELTAARVAERLRDYRAALLPHYLMLYLDVLLIKVGGTGDAPVVLSRMMAWVHACGDEWLFPAT